MSFDSGQKETIITCIPEHSKKLHCLQLICSLFQWYSPLMRWLYWIKVWRAAKEEALLLMRKRSPADLHSYLKASPHMYERVTEEKQRDSTVLHIILEHLAQEEVLVFKHRGWCWSSFRFAETPVDGFSLPTAKRALSLYVTPLVPISGPILPLL